MRHHLVTAAGALVGAVLGVIGVVAVAAQSWVLAAAAGSALAVALLVVQLDTWRRTRSLRSFVRTEVRRQGGGAPSDFVPGGGATVTQDDVVGAVRLMQAQYTGRIDRMQRSLDQALAQLSRARPSDTDAR